MPTSIDSSVRKIPWLAKALSSASASSADWLGSKGAEHEAHVEGKAKRVVDFDRQYCSSVLHLLSSYHDQKQNICKSLNKTMNVIKCRHYPTYSQ